MQITKELVDKIKHLLSFGLVKGLGKPIPGQMCVEALIANALGKEHTDLNYECVLPLLNKIKINLNDCDWSSNEARAKGMAKLAIAQLGSNILDEHVFIQKFEAKVDEKLLPYLVKKHKERDPRQSFRLDELTAGGWNRETANKLRKYSYHYCNNYYYYYNYYYIYYFRNFGDEWLNLVADTILEVLIEMKSPGCEWI
jgi:hypothetical protein